MHFLHGNTPTAHTLKGAIILTYYHRGCKRKLSRDYAARNLPTLPRRCHNELSRVGSRFIIVCPPWNFAIRYISRAPRRLPTLKQWKRANAPGKFQTNYPPKNRPASWKWGRCAKRILSKPRSLQERVLEGSKIVPPCQSRWWINY